MRIPLVRFQPFALALLLILLSSSLPALAGAKSAQNTVLTDSNLYRYANNNPVNYLDPKGLSCEAARDACLATARATYELATLVGREAIHKMAEYALKGYPTAFLIAKDVMDEFDEWGRPAAEGAYDAAKAQCEFLYRTCVRARDACD